MIHIVSKEANLSKIYTYHCKRANWVSFQYEHEYEVMYIIELSGHKSESSIRLYASRLYELKKHAMSTAVASKVISVTRKTVAMENTSYNLTARH